VLIKPVATNAIFRYFQKWMFDILALNGSYWVKTREVGHG